MKSDDIKSAAADLGNSASKDATAARQGAEEAASGLAGQAQAYKAQASDAASELYGRAKDGISQAADALPGSASEAAAAGRRAYEGGTDQLARQVAKQPFEALLLAGAIGYLVGWATSRS